MFRKIGLIVGCLACGMILLSACSIHDLSEAKQIVAQADSVWAEGGMYSDSLSLAQAYETLSSFNYPLLSTLNSQLSTDFVHACYHYGKLLRAKDDPVAAMQVFINATHAGSEDKQILGRIYNTMGDICHRANEFDLSYDMFKRSAEVFLSDKDTLSYYYCLNDMAFELAEQGKKDSANTLLHKIQTSKYSEVQKASYRTTIILLRMNEEYATLIQYVDSIFSEEDETFMLIAKSQAYFYLHKYDSASAYALKTLESSNSLFEKDNAYYILIRCDSIGINNPCYSVYTLNANRADVEKQIEIRHGKLSQAVQLLEQNLNRKLDWRRYVIWALLTISVLLFVIGLHVWEKHKQQLSFLSQKHAADIIESIKKHIDVTDLKTTLHWKNYEAMKSDADLYMGGLVTKLESYHLNEVEIRFCILTLLDFPLKKIAETINYSYPSAIKTLKKRIANKLSTTPSSLKDFLLHLPPKA